MLPQLTSAVNILRKLHRRDECNSYCRLAFAYTICIRWKLETSSQLLSPQTEDDMNDPRSRHNTLVNIQKGATCKVYASTTPSTHP